MGGERGREGDETCMWDDRVDLMGDCGWKNREERRWCGEEGAGLFPSVLDGTHMHTRNTHTHTQGQRGTPILTVTFHALVDEAVQQGSTVVAEGGAAVRVDLKLVLAPGVLRRG